MAFTVFLLYLSMYLIHNAVGTLCIIKTSEDNKNNEGDIDASRLLYKVNNSNLFADTLNMTTQMQNQKDYNTHVNVESSPNIDLDDIFISVKTTRKYHETRLRLIIETWFQLAKDQVWFFTDHEDEIYQNLTNNHMVHTNCGQGHSRKSLCCKMNREFDFFLSTSKKFWCHFDDDNYVNIPTLVKVLGDYHAYHEWYLGKPSISSPIEMYMNAAIMSLEQTKKYSKEEEKRRENEKVKFWFATGGAGFCISRALAIKMMPLTSKGKFIAIGDGIRFPDDVTLGFIIEYLLKVPLTVVNPFHSHLERMDHIDTEIFRDQISFSYAHIKDDWNVVKVVNGFDTTKDPYRFYSLHCYLFPHFEMCKSLRLRR
ncbi:hypothetical protein PVAND_010024 [Polypedilum vanderplanki]|uniref:Fringe-like glycosyltransferase domain-containing protein n=1 Tax=Polypedilum vanderplanki TaxID=319348 RepID=A0A9J6CF00_POLVA|nr:hypothetical protein PVAND_010024 [Polypedilum vanderplanki]